MPKGKFSHPRTGNTPGGSRPFRKDETTVLPKPTENPLEDFEEAGNYRESRMPRMDDDFLSRLDFSEESDPAEFSPDSQEDPCLEYEEKFQPIPPRYIPTEEEKIEQAFQEAVEKQNRPVSPFRKKLSVSWQRHKKPVLITCGVLLLTAALGVSGIFLYRTLADPYDHLILKGVTVAGVDVGGMTRQQAEQAIAAAADPFYSGTDMRVKLPEQELKLSPQATKISLDAGAAAKAAYSYGRTGSRQDKEADYRNSLIGEFHVDLLPFLDADKKYIEGQLQGYADGHNSSFTPSSYALEGEQPPLDLQNFNQDNTPQTLLLILGNPGYTLDVSNGCNEIMKAYARMDLNPALKLQAGDTLPEELDLNRIHEEYSIEPVNSTMDLQNYDVISGSYGYTFNLQIARRKVAAAQYGDTVRIPMEYVEPEIKDEEVYFRDVLSTAVTPHGNNENRNVNLDLACKALDGLILYPGDEFSYNEALGERTADKGYKGAPAYSGDKLVNSLGGGICQVSSTLYYSCLLADLEITDRINHGFLPSYIDPGMDATVSWGRPDYKFRNNTNFPIKIHAVATDKDVTIQILGTDDKDYYIVMEYEMSDVYPNEVYKDFDASSGYYDGQVIDGGTNGHHVKTFRCKYSKKTDVLISRELETRSSYMTRDKIIARVKEDKPPEAEAPSETQTPSEKPAPPETQAPAPEGDDTKS